MENMRGSQTSNTTTKRKRMRRRSQTRRAIQDSIINIAEARREIVQALQLHRSSSSSLTTRTRTTATAISASAASMLGNVNKVGSSSSSQRCYYSLTESMPIPGPIWSTTAPSIPPTPPPPAAVATECLEFEWGESQASSYSWWLGFLKTLDSKKSNAENSKYHPSHFEKFEMGNPLGFGNNQDGSKLGEGTLVDGTNDQTNSSPDEWLTFPTTGDHHHQGVHTTTSP